MHSSPFRFLALLCLLTLPASAQKFAVKSIAFTGYTAATQADLLAASGLTQPASFTQAELQAAAQKLNDTGLFNRVNYKFDGQELSFQLTPTTVGLFPAKFDNFAWLDLEAIDQQLRAKLPLYKGKVIAGSGLEQQVIEAVTALAAQQHLTASIQALPLMDEKINQQVAERFRIVSPSVTVSQLIFEGASAAEQEKLAPVAKAAVGEDYSLADTPEELISAIVNIYRNQGFLDAKVMQVTNTAPAISADKVSVPVAATIVEGGQYKLGKLTLDGSVLMTQDAFQKRALLKPGDIANQEMLRRTLQLAGSPYRTKGYLRAKIAAVPTLDTANHLADYAIHVEPGEQYHMGRLELANLTDTQKAKFLSVWKMNAGDHFDATYPPTFLLKNKNALQELDEYSASYKQYEHEDTHVVDMVVTFQKGGSLK